MKIRIFTTLNSGVIDYSTTAKTWGDLKLQLIRDGYYKEGGSKAVLRETKATLEADGIVMPTTAYTVFITPTQTKSGCTTYVLTENDVDDLVDYVLEHAVENVAISIREFIADFEEDSEATQLRDEFNKLKIN